MLEGPSDKCARCPLHFVSAKPGEAALHECALLSANRMRDLETMYRGAQAGLQRALSAKYDCKPSRAARA